MIWMFVFSLCLRTHMVRPRITPRSIGVRYGRYLLITHSESNEAERCVRRRGAILVPWLATRMFSRSGFRRRLVRHRQGYTHAAWIWLYGLSWSKPCCTYTILHMWFSQNGVFQQVHVRSCKYILLSLGWEVVEGYGGCTICFGNCFHAQAGIPDVGSECSGQMCLIRSVNAYEAKCDIRQCKLQGQLGSLPVLRGSPIVADC